MQEQAPAQVLPQWHMREGSKQGSKHVRLGYNNQDAKLSQSFTIAKFGKTYHVGIVSDGCSGNPFFSHTEVGAHLGVLYSFRRIQELICSRVPLDQIPQVLYPSITEFMLDMTNKLMPSHIAWNYPLKVKDREHFNGQARLRTDYLAATLLGFIADEEDLVTFSAGDGVILINNDLNVIDQNDKPDYPVVSINSPGQGFTTNAHKMNGIQRLAISTDGLSGLMRNSQEFRDKLFSHQQGQSIGLQTLLNVTSMQSPEEMKDDCTVVTLLRANQ